MAEGTRCPPPRIAGEDDSPAFLPDHTNTGGVGLTDALERLDDPAPWDRFTNAAGRPGPASRRLGAAHVGLGGLEDMPRLRSLAALVRGSDGEVAEFDCRGGCGLTDGQLGELPQRRRWEGS